MLWNATLKMIWMTLLMMVTLRNVIRVQPIYWKNALQPLHIGVVKNVTSIISLPLTKAILPATLPVIADVAVEDVIVIMASVNAQGNILSSQLIFSTIFL